MRKELLLTDFLRESTASLEHLYPTAEARNIVLMLCEEVIGTRNYTHIVEPGYLIDRKKLPRLEEGMERLRKGEPIQYVTGRTEFCGRFFRVTSDTLIPRPETEMLCREAIRMAKQIQRFRSPYGRDAEPVRILDLCTGSGNIAWTLALSVPGVRVVGVDLSEGALKVAGSQPFAAELKATGSQAPVFVRADVLDTEQEFPYGPFDIVLANPPYIMEKERPLLRRNVLEYEPSSALFVPDEDPLIFYRAIARWADRFLEKDGKGMTEINECLGAETEALFRAGGWREVARIRDFFDKPRFIFFAR